MWEKEVLVIIKCIQKLCLRIVKSRKGELFNKQQILDYSKLKAFADDKINLIEKLKFVLGRLENIMGKGENAGYQCLQKSGLCGKELNTFGNTFLEREDI